MEHIIKLCLTYRPLHNYKSFFNCLDNLCLSSRKDLYEQIFKKSIYYAIVIHMNYMENTEGKKKKRTQTQNNLHSDYLPLHAFIGIQLL